MKQILVVDDDKEFREAVITTLESAGFEVIEADNGDAGFDMARMNLPDLIISDVMMENGNGFFLRVLLQEDERTASIPMILMTGAAQQAGAWESDPEVEYLSKPFKGEELLSAIRKKIG